MDFKFKVDSSLEQIRTKALLVEMKYLPVCWNCTLLSLLSYFRTSVLQNQEDKKVIRFIIQLFCIQPPAFYNSLSDTTIFYLNKLSFFNWQKTHSLTNLLWQGKNTAMKASVSFDKGQ